MPVKLQEIAMTDFSGIWVPLVTPFRDGEIDFAALEKLVRHLLDAGVAGLVVCGSTGEAAALDEAEQLALLDAVLAMSDRPVVMGLAGNHMPSLLARLERIARRPVAGLLVPPPYYIRPSQTALADYFHALADAGEAPLIVYNIPYRTGIAIELDTMRQIAAHPRIVALKDCGGDAAMMMQLIEVGDLAVLNGEDPQLFTTLCLGGAGAIVASAHLRPDLFVRLAKLLAEDRLAAARALFRELLPLIRLLFEEPNPAPLKAALAIKGFLRDELRLPMRGASGALRERLAQELLRLDSVSA
jgi:4-hydroxy-tetrahydrodipicolinate synthase